MFLKRFEKREFRSFRITKNLRVLKHFFEKENSFSWFMMIEGLAPKTRFLLRESFAKFELDLFFISKNTVILWMLKDIWFNIGELLLGNVVKIGPRENSSSLEREAEIFYFLMGVSNLNLRFYYSNQEVYREEKVKLYLDRVKKNENFKNVLAYDTLTGDNLIEPLVTNTIKERPNYIIK